MAGKIRAALLCAIVAAGSVSLHRPAAVSAAAPMRLVEANDNRKPAGFLENGVLTLELIVDSARWYPSATDGPHVDLVAFSEMGGPPQIPGPLIRVPVGTTISARITNYLKDSVIYIQGFGNRPQALHDSVAIKPGETHSFWFNVGAPGTYMYRGIVGNWDYDKGETEQLTGAIVVDEPGARTDDRVFVMNIWSGLMNPGDTLSRARAMAINGKSWPYTERITTTVGDTLRWRVVNGTNRAHPMHLHGFYFRIDQSGDMWRDTTYTASNQRIAVTEDMSVFNTMGISIVPERPGNWLFHCHLTFHVMPGSSLPVPSASEHGHSGDPMQHMAGLVLGIVVKPKPGAVAEERTNVRRLHLYVQEGKRRGVAPRSLGYVLQRDSRIPALDSVEIPGSVITLTKNQPTDIVVINRLKEPTAVHWHGIELESYSDGVPGWSGADKLLAPMIAPNDSFVARLSLPRSGTFMYHTHLNDIEQITSGLYGALIVSDPGKPINAKRDHVVIVGWDGPKGPELINGDSASGPPIEINAGETQRFRFINIGPANRMFFSIRKDTTVTEWRALAKDGADLPSVRAIKEPAIKRLNVGEMYDAEFTALEKGEYVLAVGRPLTRMKYTRKVIVH